MKWAPAPFTWIVVGFLIILVSGIYFVYLTGLITQSGNKICVTDLTDLADQQALELANTRCNVAYNMLLMNDKISYDLWSMRHRSASLQLQLYSTVLLLAVVIFIIFFGLVMSYLEFRKGGNSTTTLKLGTADIEVSSTVTGLIVLSISLGFAYLYFDKAYKISEIATESSTSPAK